MLLENTFSADPFQANAVIRTCSQDSSRSGGSTDLQGRSVAPKTGVNPGSRGATDLRSEVSAASILDAKCSYRVCAGCFMLRVAFPGGVSIDLLMGKNSERRSHWKTAAFFIGNTA
jgi:hypothetical protein